MSKAGFPWYELSNWSKPGHECRHNQAYWLSADWWGLGAGAHSHLDGERWWNIKHPSAYIEAASAAISPAAGSEVLSESEREVERVMLQIRMRSGIKRAAFTSAQQDRLEGFASRGLFLDGQWRNGRVVLSLEGRLLADQIVRELLL